MASAKTKSLKVRPFQSVDLCFDSDGIIGEQNLVLAKLGAPVTAFDVNAFYASLTPPQPTTGDPTRPGQLKLNSLGVYNAVKPSLLYALRAEPTKAVLDKAIAMRENSFYQKYVAQTSVITQTLNTYDPTVANSKPDRLSKLAAISELQRNTLNTAYTGSATDPRNPANPSKGVVTATTTSTNVSSPQITNTTTVTDSPKPPGSADTKTVTTPYSQDAASVSTNTDYDYRFPTAENDAQYQRAQVSLLDEQYAQFMFAQNLKFLQTVFNNELNSIDLDIKRLQVAYFSTLLVSPIDGLVTGLFRDPGDCVKAGQAVLRVENDVQVYLVGTIIFRGLIRVGSTVTVTTKIFDSPTTLPPLTGSVVSIRGHDSKDDVWDLLVLCSNRDGSGNPILPLNYNFDYDDTTIDIS